MGARQAAQSEEHENPSEEMLGAILTFSYLYLVFKLHRRFNESRDITPPK